VARARAADRPNNDTRWVLPVVLRDLGELHMTRGWGPEAAAHYAEALRHCEAWVKAEPDNPRAREALGFAHLDVAKERARFGETAVVRRHYGLSAAVREALVKDNPGRSEYVAQLALTYQFDGNYCLEVRDTAAARECYRKRLALYEPTAGGGDWDRTSRQDRINALHQQGWFLDQLKQPAETQQCSRSVLERYREALKGPSPGDDEDRSRRGEADALEWLGDLAMQLGDPVSGVELVRQSVNIREKMLSGLIAYRQTLHSLSFGYI